MVLPLAWLRCYVLALMCALLWPLAAGAQEAQKPNLSPLFVQISDAMGAAKAGDDEQARQALDVLRTQLQGVSATGAVVPAAVEDALQTAVQAPRLDELTAISVALMAWERELNPLDVEAEKARFKRRIVPAFERWQEVLAENRAQPDVAALKEQYRVLNSTWTRDERSVRNVDMGHYGRIETTLALLRVALETEPLDYARLTAQTDKMAAQFADFLSGQQIETPGEGEYRLSDGIELLQAGLEAFRAQDAATGQEKLTTFIEIWPAIEGEVSTRNGALYNRVESEVPVILAKGGQPQYQESLQQIITALGAIQPAANYSAVDAMLILLREGVEALLIVLALVGALRAAQRPQGYKWVWGGVVAGIVLSVVLALALHMLLPAATSGTSRELIEGGVGLVAVLMIVSVGAWLHSKSSVQAWQAYVRKHMNQALTAASFVPLFGLSFLSVFREGAETILFYMGILPKISMVSFLLGVGMAVALLIALAFVMLKGTVRLAAPTMFKVLTWLLYALGFKMLGISVHTLQLTGVLPMHILEGVPNVDFIGLYATREGLLAQAGYVVVIVLLQYWMRRAERQHRPADEPATSPEPARA